MRLLFIGDIVGRAGRTIVIERLPGLMRMAWASVAPKRLLKGA